MGSTSQARKRGTLASLPIVDPSPPILGKLDRGIEKAVRTLQANGIETFESCEGGTSPAYPEPTIRFHGSSAAGWHAVGVCLDNGLPITSLRRVWDILDQNLPTGPYWEITFRERIY
jgi:hypothetical protein